MKTITLDLDFVRSQFPAFSDPDLKGWAFFENAGGSYPCRQTVERLTYFYEHTKVQPYYPYPASEKAGEQMDMAYGRIAAYLNVKAEEIHLGPSTTQNVYVLAHAMRPMWQEGDEIIVSCQDHEANAGAWRRLGREGLKIVEWHVDKETGMLDIEELKKLLTIRSRIVAFPHCSNVIGYINPAREISDLARQYGAISVIDGVGWAPHGFPDLKELGADIYMFSTYKTYGPHLGVMYVASELMSQLENQSHFFKEGITRNMITPAGPDHSQVAAINGILDYFDTLYDHHFGDQASPAKRNVALNQLFRQHEEQLQEELLSFLRSREDLRIIGPVANKARAPIISILPKKNIHEVYAALVRHKLMPGIGNFYAYRPLMDMDIPTDPGVIRMSFVHYTAKEEVGQLIRGLETAL